ncbi:MAG: GyrI-like domain-containing protein [Alphaproteobacteria bacterium]|nr:GyrI-like domain-containing protein [Alphaproteobacteria bacterium]
MTEPTIILLDSFLVGGISTRTRNSDETPPATNKIGPLWGRFHQQGLINNIPHPANGRHPYGIYADYESDDKGFYTLTAGVKITAPPPPHSGFTSVAISAGHYLQFSKKGPLPQVVIDLWRDIWQYFSTTQTYQRLYSTDIEDYGGDGITIFIAVRGS